jgi:hypothetical protein
VRNAKYSIMNCWNTDCTRTQSLPNDDFVSISPRKKPIYICKTQINAP